MSMDPKECLVVEQSMEEENHVLLQVEIIEPPIDKQLQLLMIVVALILFLTILLLARQIVLSYPLLL
jgi:hypothetical protein